MSTQAITDLAALWRRSGVEAGDTVLLHSSVGRTVRGLMRSGRPAPGVAQDVLDSFLQAVTPTGTLLLPLFNFAFTEGVTFDIRSSPSQMGSLTEAGRQRAASVRTGHPIYSFAVIGAQAERFRGLENFSGYGADSPFGVLRAMGGRIAILDLPDQHSMTFYHHVEEMLEAPWRFHKRFEGGYVGWDGVETRRTFGLYVRDLERGVVTDVDPMGERLWARGLYRGERPGQESGLRTIDANLLFEAVAEVIAAGDAEGLLYRVEKAS